MPSCPECKNSKTWKDGLRYVQDKVIQRYLCRYCGFRFSDNDYKLSQTRYSRQICVLDKEAKNLVGVKSPTKEWAAGATKSEIQTKILEYLWYLKKKGLKSNSIEHYGSKLRLLSKRQVNLLDPEDLKAYLANNEEWSNRTKSIIVTIYDGFVKFFGIHWEPPKYKPIKEIPFIPTEKEIDQFIGACGKKLAAFMQLLKETGMRCGEASLLKWIDLDYERQLVRITPEKNSNPRILRISTRLLGMLNNLPKTSDRIFSGSLRTMKSNIYLSRKGIARKLNNPRLLKITFHTLRHWKGTTEYHKTRDIIHVQKVLGHQDIKSTMIYITLENSIYEAGNDEFHVKATKSIDEACKLLESGFEYVTDIDEVHIFRKRK